MNRRTIIKLAALSLVPLAMSGCTSMLAKNVDGPAMLEKLMGDWNLTSLMGQDVAKLLPAGATAPSLSFDNEGKVSGFAGVNRLSSKLDVASLGKGEFKLAPAAMTKMAGPPEQTKVENMFIDAMGKVSGFKLDGNSLDLKRGAETLMKFAKAS